MNERERLENAIRRGGVVQHPETREYLTRIEDLPGGDEGDSPRATRRRELRAMKKDEVAAAAQDAGLGTDGTKDELIAAQLAHEFPEE